MCFCVLKQILLSISCFCSIGYVGSWGFGFVLVSSFSSRVTSTDVFLQLVICLCNVIASVVCELIISIFFSYRTHGCSARSKVRGTLEIYHAYIRDSDTSSRGDADWEIVDNNSTTVSVSVYTLYLICLLFCCAHSLELIAGEESYSYLVFATLRPSICLCNCKIHSHSRCRWLIQRQALNRCPLAGKNAKTPMDARIMLTTLQGQHSGKDRRCK